MNCADCRFYTLTADSTYGNCRRFPPTPVIKNDNEKFVCLWPLVAVSDWCGEYETKLVDQKPEAG